MATPKFIQQMAFVLFYSLSPFCISAQQFSLSFVNEFDEALRYALVTVKSSDGNMTIIPPTRLDENGMLPPKSYPIQANTEYKVMIKLSLDNNKEDLQPIYINLTSGQTLSVETTSFKSILDKSEPGLKISAEQLSATGYNTLDQALQYLMPSFFATPQTIADGTDDITPVSLKGLGPDQMLVLIESKRRPGSPQLNVNGTFGRGTVSNDLSTIPVESVREIEILKTAASVKYGSDAIAGIINVLLKKTGSVAFGVQGGNYLTGEKDLHWWNKGTSRNGREQEAKIWATTSGKFGKKGTIFFAGNITHLGAINRSGNYTGHVYNPTDVIAANDPFWLNTGYRNMYVMEIGRAKIQQASLQFNLETPLTSDGKIKFYSFGGGSFKTGNATGFYRFPKDFAKVNYNLYPFGFSPRILTRISETFWGAGLEIQSSLGKFDISHTIGSGSLGFYVNNSNNASLGELSPSQFYCGSLTTHQNTTSARWETKAIAHLMRIKSGIELRTEQFAIAAGDEASWYAGPDTTKEPGAQVFPGFSPETEVNKQRQNFGVFTEINISKEINEWGVFLSPGVRYETFSNAKGAPIGKIAFGLFSPDKVFGFHTSINGGYRAPSLQQIYYSKVSTQFQGAKALQIATVSNENLIARNFEIPDLKPEFSQTFNIGTSINPDSSKWQIDVDYTRTLLRDRIVLSGTFSKSNPEFAPKFAGLDVDAAQFFNNYPNTLTNSFDFMLKRKISEKLTIWSGLSYNKTEVIRDSSKLKSDLLKKNELVFFNREEESRLTSVIPLWKGIFAIQGILGNNPKYSFLYRAQVTVFGQNKYVYPDTSSALLDPYQKNVLDVTYKNANHPIVDFEGGINFKTGQSKMIIAVGCNNLLNWRSNPVEQPDVRLLTKENQTSALNLWRDNISSNGLFNYSRRVQTYGVGGRMVYIKVKYIIR